MKQDTTNLQLQAQISRLQGTVEEGFKGVNDHLTTLNHQVLDHSKIINKIIASDNFSNGQKSGVTNTLKVLVAVLTLAVALLGIYIAVKYHITV